MNRRLQVGSAVLTAAVLIFTAGAASGSGFAIVEQSARGIGNAFAGASTETEDAGAMYFNAAGIGFIENDQAILGVHAIMPSFEFTDKGSTPVGGGDGGDAGVTAFVPNLYVVHPATEQLNIGLGVTAPFGLQTEYDSDWVGRFHTIDTELMTVNINPTAAWRVNEMLALAVGVSAQYADAELTSALSPLVPGAEAKVCGDDWGYGFNVGALCRLDTGTRVGLSYRSRIEHELDGDISYDGLRPPSGGSADLDTPETVSLGLYQQITEAVAVMADVTWTGWSAFDELVIEDDAGRIVGYTDEDWDDTMRYALGLTCACNEQWTVRSGVAYDETPIPRPENRTARIPDGDRTWVAVGLGYAAAENVVVDVGYVHLFIEDTDINHVYDPMTGARLVGEFEGDADIVSVQVRWDI